MPLGRTRYVPNNASVARLLMSQRMEDVVMDAGREIAEDARALAAQYSDTGEAAAEGWDVHEGVGAQQAEGGIRRIAEINTDNEALIAQELGTDRTPARHILMRAALPFHVPRFLRAAVARGEFRL